MEAFKVAPFDQNLCLNGQYLTDNSKTLGHLRILPKSLIYLRADEPNPGISAIEPDDGWNMQHPEEGFKGMQTFLFMSGSSHIQSVLIGVEYRNCRRTLDVYLLFPFLLVQIISKLNYRLVTYKQSISYKCVNQF